MRKILNSPIQGSVAWAIYIALLVFGAIALTLSSGCKTSEEVARNRAVKEEQSRQAHMVLLEETRKAFPCDSLRIHSVDSIYQLIPGDTVIVDRVAYIHDTAVIRRTITKYVRDSAWLQQYRDSLSSERYAGDIARQDANDQAKRADKAEAQLSAAKDDSKAYKRIVYIGGAILAAVVGGAIFSMIKGFI